RLPAARVRDGAVAGREPLVHRADLARDRARVEPERCGRRQVRGHVPRRRARASAPHRLRRVAAGGRPAGDPRHRERGGGMKADAALDRLLPADAGARTFPDGADFRIEIPSVEGPEVLETVIAAAAEEGIVVNRVSQGSGAMLLREDELRAMAALGADHGIEVSLFVGPRESYGIAAHPRTPDGAGHGGQARGLHGLRYAVEDIARAVECGIRGFLIPDLGLLALVNELQRGGELPASVVWKISVMLAPSNPLALRELE